MAKIVEVQIAHPCPLTRSHPGMLEGIPVFPVMEESTADSWSFSEQRLVGQTAKHSVEWVTESSAHISRLALMSGFRIFDHTEKIGVVAGLIRPDPEGGLTWIRSKAECRRRFGRDDAGLG